MPALKEVLDGLRHELHLGGKVMQLRAAVARHVGASRGVVCSADDVVITNGLQAWRSIGKGTVTRIELPGCTRDEVAVDFPEIRARELRILIYNADNPPLEISDLHPFGPAYRLLWLADPGAAYRLAYGNAELAPPAYDLFAIRTALEKGLEPDAWELADGGQAAPVAKHFRLGAFLARPAVFGTILFLAALALLGLLARALKKTV